MSDPSVNEVLELIAPNTGSVAADRDTPRSQLVILEEIAENTSGGLGGGEGGTGTPYDDTVIKSRVTAVEDENEVQGQTLTSLTIDILSSSLRKKKV